MGVESYKLLAELADHIHLVDQDFVKITNKNFDITLRLVNLMKQIHVFASDVNNVIDMLSMALYELLFFF